MCLMLNDFPDHDHIISTLTIQRDLLNPIWDILGEVFYNNSGAFIECSRGHF